MSELKLNVLPSPTWNWLRMNDTSYQVKKLTGGAAPKVCIPDKVRAGEETFPKDFDGGIGREFTDFLDKEEEKARVFDIDYDMADPIRLRYQTGKDQAVSDRVMINVAEGKKGLVVMNFTSDGSDGQLAVQTAVNIAKDAELTLFSVMRTGEDSVLMNDIGTQIGDGGRFNLVQIVLGGKDIFLGVKNHLSGTASEIDMKLGYYMTGDDNLDVNYIASHTGQKTKCNIYANGILRDRSQKTFRGTIDFIKGCKGAKGDELEDVLLMDKTVRNKTIPVILCAEEDVEGNHGATIGKLASDILFYLESRGMDQSEVYEMMARARIDAIADQIGDEETRKLAKDYFQTGE